jgi:hypothetical protein
MLIAKFPDGISEITVNGLHQWNYGQQLQIEASDLPALFEVHFAHPGIKDAIVRTCAAVNGVATVAIPDVCLEQSRTIQAWIYEIKETAGKTTKTIRLNVIKRVRPAVGGDIPRKISDKYTEAVAAMNEVVDDLKNGNIRVSQAVRADRADKAGSAYSAQYTTVLVVKTLDEIAQVIEDYPGVTRGISLRTQKEDETGIIIPTTTGDLYIPNWSYGTLTVDETNSATLHLTAYTGDVFHLWYNGKSNVWVKGLIKAATADILRPKALHYESVTDTLLLDVYEPGIYAVSFKAENSSSSYTAVFFITDLRRKVAPGGSYPGFSTVEYQSAGVDETGKQHGYIAIDCTEKGETVIADIVCISQAYYE